MNRESADLVDDGVCLSFAIFRVSFLKYLCNDKKKSSNIFMMFFFPWCFSCSFFLFFSDLGFCNRSQPTVLKRNCSSMLALFLLWRRF